MTGSTRGKNTRVAFYTLGCKLNQAETESLACQFVEAGYHPVAPDDVADIYIANTCTVTHIADRKSRHWLRLARRRNPEALIIATGCYVQRASRELAPIADLVIDNSEKERLVEIVKDLPLRVPSHSPSKGEGVNEGEIKQSRTFHKTRVRSMIKIQDGCHSPCTYCIVPRVRPREYSLPATQLVEQIKEKVACGYREVVLTGTKIGCYGHDGTNLKELIEGVLRSTGVQRLRLSSLQPQELSAQLLSLWQDNVAGTGSGARLCRHFHLALQSGSNTVLNRMRRSYSLSDYQMAMNKIREAVPGAAITTDIMVGFPEESDEEFEQSYLFCQQAGFANIHVFPFSIRPGTEAARMPNQVNDRVKKERANRMLGLAGHCRQSFYEQFVGQIMPALWEKETKPGSNIYSGLTDNYIRILARSEKPLTNIIAPVKLVNFHNDGMWGELSSESAG